MRKNPTPLQWLTQAIQSHTGDDCILWPFTKTEKGYGQIRFEGHTRRAHRVAFKLVFGRWPSDNCCHRCDNLNDAAAKKRMPHGEDNIHSKLTDDLVRSIRAEYVPRKWGSGMRILARQYGMSRSSLRDVVLRKSWTHVA